MSQQHFYRDNAGDIAEATGHVQFLGENPGQDGFTQNAEEGSIGSTQVRVDDPTGIFDVRGHRLWWSQETEAAGDDFGGVFGVGYTTLRRVTQDFPFDGTGRAWTIDIVDINSVLERRVLLGADCKRPAETDVARIQWLFGIDEMLSAITDDTYLSTANPVMMSKADYRKQRPRDVLDDAAQQSSKNWYLLNIVNAFTFSLWYGAGSLETFVSDAIISNHPDDEGDAGVYEPGDETEFLADPTRVASGVLTDADNFFVYRTRPQTATDFAIGGRDVTMSAPNVKTKAAAEARTLKYLRDFATEEFILKTSITVSAEDVNIVRHGHRIQARITWAPYGYDEVTWYRVLNRTTRAVSPTIGAVKGKYRIDLELSPDTPVTSTALCTGLTETGSLALPDSDLVSADGNVLALRPGIPYPEVVTPGHQGASHFPEFAGSVNYAGDCGQNIYRALVVGDGEISWPTVTYMGSPRNLIARLMHADPGAPGEVVVDEYQEGTTGDTFTFTVDTHGGVACTHFLDITDTGAVCGGKWGVTAPDWTAA